MTRIGTTRLKILAAILDRPGFPPTYAEIAALVGCYTDNIRQHTCALVKEGLLAHEDFAARTLTAMVRFIPADQLGDQP